MTNKTELIKDTRSYQPSCPISWLSFEGLEQHYVPFTLAVSFRCTAFTTIPISIWAIPMRSRARFYRSSCHGIGGKHSAQDAKQLGEVSTRLDYRQRCMEEITEDGSSTRAGRFRTIPFSRSPSIPDGLGATQYRNQINSRVSAVLFFERSEALSWLDRDRNEEIKGMKRE